MQPPVPPQQPPVGGGPVALTRDAAVRTRDAVRYVESQVRGGKPLPGRGRPASLIWLRKALTGTGGILPATGGGATPGSATVTFCTWNGSSWVAGSDAVTAYNPSGSAVGGSKVVTLGWVDGIWEVVVEPC